MKNPFERPAPAKTEATPESEGPVVVTAESSAVETEGGIEAAEAKLGANAAELAGHIGKSRKNSENSIRRQLVAASGVLYERLKNIDQQYENVKHALLAVGGTAFVASTMAGMEGVFTSGLESIYGPLTAEGNFVMNIAGVPISVAALFLMAQGVNILAKGRREEKAHEGYDAEADVIEGRVSNPV